MKFLKRVQLALKVLQMKNFEETLSGYEFVEHVAPFRCDDCGNEASVCMSRLNVKFETRFDDHFHCCTECQKRVKGKTQFHREIT